MSMMNRQFVLAERPVGMPTEATFKLVETPLPDLKDGEVLVKALYLSWILICEGGSAG
jgi:NADPH-dependent curcumin reductase CurA